VNSSNRTFLILFITFELILGWVEYIGLPPIGMHQGAQVDRASIALNYFQESKNFFEPRVMESRAFHGITGLEFPIIQYLVACLYNIFGFHEFIYRVVVGIISMAGLWAVWNILGQVTQKNNHKIFIWVLWASSPIFVFYQWNFLPDIPSLSLSMLGWWYFLQAYNGKLPSTNFLKSNITLLFAGLLKVTLLSNWIIMLVIVLFGGKFKLQKTQLTTKLWSFILPLFIVPSWYVYANHLTEKTYNYHFLQKTNLPSSFSELIENTKFAINTWLESIYPQEFIILLILIFLFVLQRNIKNLELWGTISIFQILSFLGIFLLFNRQFVFHDYYFIQILPSIFFMVCFIYQKLIFNQLMFRGMVGIIVMVGLFVAPFINFFHAKNQLRRTFTEGDYYNQSLISKSQINDLKKAKHWLDRKYPKTNYELITAEDPSPNTNLYFLKEQGIRIAPDFDLKLSKKIVLEKLHNTPNTLPVCVLVGENQDNISPLLESNPMVRIGDVRIIKILEADSIERIK